MTSFGVVQTPDKVDLTDLENLKDRDQSFRTVIENKKYDTCHEDDLCRLLVKNARWGSMLLIRYEYYLSKSYHNLGKGDLVFWDPTKQRLYAVELKSLKDQYSSTTEQSKIDKCIEQSIKYGRAAMQWCGHEAIPVTVIEYSDGSVVCEERRSEVLRPANAGSAITVNGNSTVPPPGFENPPTESVWAKKEPIKLPIPVIDTWEPDKWFTHPGDQTETRYKISGDCLEAERTVDKEPSSGSRRSFRRRVKRVATECSTCKMYFLQMKNTEGEILMNEMRPIEDEV